MIPIFPAFDKLQLSHIKELEVYIKEFPPYSDYNFVSLWVYNTSNSIELSLLNKNLVVKFEDYITGEPLYSFIGTTDLIKTSDLLLDHAREMNITPDLKLIPESVIKSNPVLSSTFTVLEDLDNFDYILSVEDLSLQKGRTNKTRRKMCHAFINNYPAHKKMFVDLNDKNYQLDVIKMFNKWCDLKSRTEEDTAHELKALMRLIEASDHFNLITLCMYYDEKIIGFTIVELVHQQYAINHFMKMDPTYRGLSSIMDKLTGDILLEKNYKYLNIEQDLGLPGLRNAKQSCHPIKYLKKYTISKKPS